MKSYHLISITHKTASMEAVGDFVLDRSNRSAFLHKLKEKFDFDELLYLGTCNRVEYLVVTDQNIDTAFLNRFLQALQPEWSTGEAEQFLSNVKHYNDQAAIRHLFEVGASLDSMVVGEREILGQLRQTYEQCRKENLTGDHIRIALEEAVRTAKHVYTATRIGEKPVSVVSIAFRKLENLGLPKDAHIAMVGAGETNHLKSKFLVKNDYTNFSLFNRSIEKGQPLADRLNTTVQPLDKLPGIDQNMDVLITCTGATEPIITTDLFKVWEDKGIAPSVIVDLALPGDVDSAIKQRDNLSQIDLKALQKEADTNLSFRKKELKHANQLIDQHMDIFQQLYEERQVENAMRSIPEQIKQVRQKVTDDVFSSEIEQLDEESKEILEKALAYMEKKCISIPMKQAKEVLLNGRDAVKK